MKTRRFLLLTYALFFSLPFLGVKEAVKTDPASDAYVTPAVFSDEPKFDQQTHFNHINRGDVLDHYDGTGVRIAIIDSGIDFYHEDFQIDKQTNILNSSASFNYDGTKVIRTTVKEQNSLRVVEDTHGHGTAVAGTIGALINGVGTAGVSPNVDLLILKTDYKFAEISAAIRYAADNHADIINLSLGAYEETFIDDWGEEHKGASEASTYFIENINYAYNKGAIIIAAAGNEHTNHSFYPAANNHVIGVGALAANSSTDMAYYSNFGTNNVQVVAPGTVYVPQAQVRNNGDYYQTQGTSFAAPIVSSAAALYKEAHPNATNADFYSDLFASAADLGAPGNDNIFGHGRLDLSNLIYSRVSLTGVSLTPQNATIGVGEELQLNVEFFPQNATNTEHIFVADDESIVFVSDDGLVTGLKPGTTKITVLTDEGYFEDEVVVTVVALVTPTLTLNSANFKQNYVFGEPLDLAHLSATFTNAKGEVTMLTGHDLTLVSGNSVTLGDVVLTFSYEGINVTITINVTNVGSSDGTYAFSAQGEAYYDYFMAKTGPECSLGNVLSTTWTTLKYEYNAMSIDAQSYLKALAPEGLLARYQIIVQKYGYEDFIYALGSDKQNTNTNNSKALISFVTLTLILTSIYFRLTKRHKKEY